MLQRFRQAAMSRRTACAPRPHGRPLATLSENSACAKHTVYHRSSDDAGDSMKTRSRAIFVLMRGL
jgi:hypothetical protein